MVMGEQKYRKIKVGTLFHKINYDEISEGAKLAVHGFLQMRPIEDRKGMGAVIMGRHGKIYKVYKKGNNDKLFYWDKEDIIDFLERADRRKENFSFDKSSEKWSSGIKRLDVGVENSGLVVRYNKEDGPKSPPQRKDKVVAKGFLIKNPEGQLTYNWGIDAVGFARFRNL